jgi:hypothetical protein
MRTHLNNIRDRRFGWRTVTRLAVAGIAALLWLAPTGALAQTGAGDERVQPGPGDARYQPERTREDYAQPTDGDKDFDYAAQTLRVSIWLDRGEDEIYNFGDEQRVGFQANEDAYAVVYRIDTDGLVTVLWPRDRMDDGFVFGGHEYKLPGREAAALRINEQVGEGYVQAIVSRYPFDLRALELDFVHESGGRSYDFHVAGDPFLAMNEVNYAVTGLEDAGDQVITNHARYYVHERVDHPRYLCSQCHTGDSAQYDPYESRCTLEIDYDYGWSNQWYSNYGYYPVYWNPVYVYVDPWTWRPWVNFWYDPWYVCAPYNGWYGSYWGCYTWNDSPYYHGGCGTYYGDGGGRRYQPLNRHGEAVAVRKSGEYGSVSRVVARSGPEPAQREAMLAKRTAAGATREARGGANAASGSAVTVARGEKPMTRSPERFTTATTTRQGGALRIRSGGGTDAAAVRSAEGPGRRHTAAGGDRAARLAPVRSNENQAGAGSRSPAATGSVRGGSGAAGKGERETIRALNPRERGSRVWNSTTSRGSQPSERNDRQDRPTRVSPNRDGADRGSPPSVAPSQRSRGDSGARRSTAPSSRREGTVPRGGSTTPRSRGESPGVSQEAPRPGREAAPARQEAPSRTEAPRSRGGDDRGSGKSNEGAARRGPSGPK